ncbi:helix-turn-helix domain-containing protein [Collinsella ihumii]|uniref:helix-turn-helix domain-containing protein n=1 Tax=Collinsella ihumii TaxID=1720204 RepID=UPI00338F4F0E
MLNIAKTIREKRRAHGYTQERLAQALGLTPAAVSKWETGQTLPDVTMLGPLAAMLGITTDELLGFDPDVSEEHAEELVEPARDALARRDISGAIERCERAAAPPHKHHARLRRGVRTHGDRTGSLRRGRPCTVPDAGRRREDRARAQHRAV